MSRSTTRMSNGSRFKLGLFAFNCSGGLTMTKAPEQWLSSWDNNVTVARQADAAGIEFLLPVARWRGYGGETDTEGSSFETLTWATGLLAATRDIYVFGTVHVPLIHPVFAAKQCVTADHVGHGRFGLNVVSGWNAPEFAMFGKSLPEHDDRYAFTEEWLTIVKKVWSETEPFEFAGRHFNLSGVASKPKPYGSTAPLIMSAGSSPTGRRFAGRNADCLFMVIVSLDTLADELKALRTAAAPRRVGVYASSHVICRRTQKEADDYYRYVVHEMGDWAAADHSVNLRKDSHSIPPDVLRHLKERLIAGTGTFPVIGGVDEVALTLQRMSDAGLDGLAMGLVNYIDDFPLIQNELLPRLERVGLRASMTNRS